MPWPLQEFAPATMRIPKRILYGMRSVSRWLQEQTPATALLAFKPGQLL